MTAGGTDTPDRPEVVLNCAISLDGKLAFAGGQRAVLSGPDDLKRVQRLRAVSDAVLVGVGTVIRDNPSLRVHWELLGQPPGRAPTRICLDGQGRIPPESRFLDRTLPTLIATTRASVRTYPSGIETIVVGQGPEIDLAELLKALRTRGVRRLMVEGGSRVLTSFLRESSFDRLTVFVAPVLIGAGSSPALYAGPEARGPESWLRLERTGLEPVDGGVLLTFRPHR